MMHSVKQNLQRVFNGNHYCIGGTHGITAGCNEIYIADDGYGPMGKYDRIHIKFADGGHIITPAHHCTEFHLAKEPTCDQ